MPIQPIPANKQIQSQEQPENVEAGHRPMSEDDKAQQQRDDAREHHPQPGHLLLHAEAFRMIRISPDTSSAQPSRSVSSDAANSGFLQTYRKPATM